MAGAHGTEPRAEQFYDTELSPLLVEVKGPVEGFVLPEARDLALKAQAVAMGEIPHGAFANLAIFDDSRASLSQERRRYAIKTGSGVLDLLIKSDEESGITDRHNQALEMAASLHVRQEMNHAAVVEAARKLHNESEEGELRPRHAKIYQQELDRAQAELYPEPDLAITRMILGRLGDKLRHLDPVDVPDDQRRFLDSFRATYPSVMERHETIAVPELSPERVEELQAALHERYKPALDTVRAEIGKDELTQKDMAPAMNIFMREIGMPMAEDGHDMRGWQCTEDTSIAGYKTLPARRRMAAGRFSAPSWRRFDQLAMHEGIGHARRSENGAATGVEAMRVGLPGNASFEEGFGLLLEQLYDGKIKQDLGRDSFRYLAVVDAEGLVDGRPHDETETLRFTSSFMTAANIASGSKLSADELLLKKRSLAYDHVKRAFRGMPEGNVLHSNLSYLQGEMDAIEFIAGLSAPADEVLDYLLQGKFNPLNKEHTQLLGALDLQATIA